LSDRSLPAPERPLSGAERAALVLRELGEGLAVDIMRQMDEQAITKISVAMTTLPKLSYGTRQEVITNFAKDFGISDIGEDGMKFITQVLTSALGETQARAIIEALSKTIALLLAHVPHESGASMLSYLPEALAADALYRFTLLDAVSPGAVKELREMIGEIMVSSAGGGRQLANLGGARHAADILNLLQTGLSDRMLGAIEARDNETAEKIRENLFTFIDLSKLSDRSIQVLLREVPSERLIAALRLVDETVRGKFFTNMSSRMVELMKEELTNGPPLRRSEALAAQNEVVAAALRLAGEGRIVINTTEELI
jgi:flagellar motor switch protein FliG